MGEVILSCVKMNQEKLKAMQESVRIGGKGTARRKKKVTHRTATTDDKKLQSSLKKLSVNNIPGIEEVNMMKNDGSVIHFNNPKVQASLAANTFAVTGHAENKQITEMLPGILNQLGAESLTHLKRLASNVTGGAGLGEVAGAGDDDDDEVPDLVENFDEASKDEKATEEAEAKISEEVDASDEAETPEGSRIEPIFLTETDQKEDVVEAPASEEVVVDPAPVDTEAPSAEEPKVDPAPETPPTEDSVEEAVVEPVAAVPASEAPVTEPAASDAPAAEPAPAAAAAEAPKSSTIGLPMTEATDAWMDDDDLGAGGFSDSDEEAAAPVCGQEPVAAEPVAAEPAAVEAVEEAAAPENPPAEEAVEESAAENAAPAAETPSEEAKDSVETIETEADIEKTTEETPVAPAEDAKEE